MGRFGGRWRWVSPGGANKGAARPSREEAMVEGVCAAAGKRSHELDADLVAKLWRSLERQGWSVEEVER